MSDARWIEVTSDLGGASRHFDKAAALFAAGGFDQPGLDGYRAEMAFLHAMQAAHTSLENGLLRILDMLGEEPPGGAQWHADLIRRAAHDLPGLRPSILPPSLAQAADEARRFRNVAARGYDGFDPTRAGQAVQAARILARGLGEALRLFRAAIDHD